jgi:hypothetical protein
MQLFQLILNYQSPNYLSLFSAGVGVALTALNVLSSCLWRILSRLLLRHLRMANGENVFLNMVSMEDWLADLARLDVLCSLLLWLILCVRFDWCFLGEVFTFFTVTPFVGFY